MELYTVTKYRFVSSSSWVFYEFRRLVKNGHYFAYHHRDGEAIS